MVGSTAANIELAPSDDGDRVLQSHRFLGDTHRTMPMDAELAIDRIAVMRQQEIGHYQCPDYLSPDFSPRPGRTSPLHLQMALDECVRFIDSLAVSRPPALSSNNSKAEESQSDIGARSRSPSSAIEACVSATSLSPRIGRRRPLSRQNSQLSCAAESSSCEENKLATWRQQMCAWSYTVVDSFGFDRESVAIAFSMLDRYVADVLSSVEGDDEDHDEHFDREGYQLLSMTCLYTAIKTLEPKRKLSIEALVDMSRGYYTPQDVLDMEIDVLMTLQWRINPPTALSYCLAFVDAFLPASLSSGMKDELLGVCRTLTELSVKDASLISFPPSCVAAAAVLVASREDDIVGELLPPFVMDHFVDDLRRRAGVDVVSDQMECAQHQLECAYRLRNEIS